MEWLPFLCLMAGAGVLAVLYSRTVGHLHRMVHQIDMVIGIHEDRLKEIEDHIVTITDLLDKLSTTARQRVAEQKEV